MLLTPSPQVCQNRGTCLEDPNRQLCCRSGQAPASLEPKRDSLDWWLGGAQVHEGWDCFHWSMGKASAWYVNSSCCVVLCLTCFVLSCRRPSSPRHRVDCIRQLLTREGQYHMGPTDSLARRQTWLGLCCPILELHWVGRRGVDINERDWHSHTASISGRKSLLAPSSLPPSSTVLSTRVPHWPPQLARLPLPLTGPPKPKMCCVSSSPTGIPLAGIWPRTQAVDVLALTQTRPLLQSTTSTLPRDATQSPSSPALIRLSPAWRCTSIPSARSTLSTKDEPPTLPLPLGDTRKTSTMVARWIGSSSVCALIAETLASCSLGTSPPPRLPSNSTTPSLSGRPRRRLPSPQLPLRSSASSFQASPQERTTPALQPTPPFSTPYRTSLMASSLSSLSTPPPTVPSPSSITGTMALSSARSTWLGATPRFWPRILPARESLNQAGVLLAWPLLLYAAPTLGPPSRSPSTWMLRPTGVVSDTSIALLEMHSDVDPQRISTSLEASTRLLAGTPPRLPSSPPLTILPGAVSSVLATSLARSLTVIRSHTRSPRQHEFRIQVHQKGQWRCCLGIGPQPWLLDPCYWVCHCQLAVEGIVISIDSHIHYLSRICQNYPNTIYLGYCT